VATRLTTPDDRERHAGVAAVRRGGTPEEVADLVDALVRNGFLTGQTIRIDGGVRLD
jgi:NAD(P)-dependent dehydrogenase (short-subunit alcohol dehydrogenase family)